MKTLLAIITITLVIACSLEPDESGTRTTSSSSSNQTTQSSSSNQTTPNNCSQNDRCYTVIINNGVSCAVMIRKGSYSYHAYTLQCSSGTTIKCMRVYDNSNFILGYESAVYGLVDNDGYGSGTIEINSRNGNFEAIAGVSLHEGLCK